MGCDAKAAAAMFIFAMFMVGPYYPGMRVNNMDITRNFSGLVMAIENGLGSLSFTPTSSLIGYMTPNVRFTTIKRVIQRLHVLECNPRMENCFLDDVCNHNLDYTAVQFVVQNGTPTVGY